MTLAYPDARFSWLLEKPRSVLLRRPAPHRRSANLSRRKFLAQYAQGASLALLPAGLGFPNWNPFSSSQATPSPPNFQVHPQYRSQRPLDELLKKVQPGLDEFLSEKSHDQIAALLQEWSSQLLVSPSAIRALENRFSASFSGSSSLPSATQPVRSDPTLAVSRLKFAGEVSLDRDAFLKQWRSSLNSISHLTVAEFQITGLRATGQSSSSSATIETTIRYEFVGSGAGFHLEQRIGAWEILWQLSPSGEPLLQKWRTLDETRSRSLVPFFSDIAPRAFGENPSFAAQLLHGSDYWRSLLDAASGIDVYGHNGVSVADIDGDGFDDLYICQPAGLPNLLFRNRADGSFEDISASSGLDILENTACALFADVNNDGHQDLIIVRIDGPQLFLNNGSGKFRLRPNAFQFANLPQGSFTGAAIADYDRDGWLDIYFCLYSYYLGAGQYRYPIPYYDAENGPPNFLLRNQRDGSFHDVTRESGLDKNNTRFSFCCAWSDFNGDLWPDLYVVNDFGRKNLYRNNGDGTFTDIAPEAGVEDVGAGMSVSTLDFDNDGLQDLYVADMWTAAGLRISSQEAFQKPAAAPVRSFYRKHAMGNSLFHNRGPAAFEDSTGRSGAALGRWAWCSDSFDFDHDGFPDLYIANGMISGPDRYDLNSFFWRQVVANSPGNSNSRDSYEQGWAAINELIRSDGTWSGFERNVFYLNNGDGSFSDVSAILGLDFIEDSRSFALADFDHDGRLELFLKSRNGPQIRLLKNHVAALPPSISFRLTGKKSNHDAIGASVTVEADSLRQTRILQAGSGFLVQHSKDLFFGLGNAKSPISATIRWPSGLVQPLRDLPLNHRIWVEEGSPPSRLEPFLTPKPSPAPPIPLSYSSEELPSSGETWLLSPIAAPHLSFVNNASVKSLSDLLGKPALLYLWTSSSPLSQKALADLEQSFSRWTRSGLQLLALNADSSETSTVPQKSFPSLRLSPDDLAVLNLLFRSLFDRHRDLPLPTSFLLDSRGDIVKVYQGHYPPERFESDAREIPQTPAARLSKALPFPGSLDSLDFSRNYLSLGSTFFERGYPLHAEPYLQQALRDDPSSAEAFYGLGSVYLQQQNLPEARKYFERAVQLRPNYPGTLEKAWNNLGIIAARDNRPAEAIQHFQRALQLAPEYAVALTNLGNVYRQQKRWKDAQDVLLRALQLNPADPDANYAIAMVYAQLNDTGLAYDYLQKALAARPAYPEALNNLGILYLRTRRTDDAKKTFADCIRLAPDYDQCYLTLARVHAIEGDPKKARAVLLELLKQHPGHPQAEQELQQLPH